MTESDDLTRDEWLTVPQTAELLSVEAETVRRWIREKSIPVLEMGGRRGGYRVRRADLNTFLHERFRPAIARRYAGPLSEPETMDGSEPKP